MTKKLYVGNLAFNTTQTQIRDLFSQAGEIAEVNLITDRYTGTPKGFAFIEMTTEEAAQEAIKRFNGYSLDGRALNVSEARPRTEGSGGSFRKSGNRF
jgi:RNA recognition motif-containing protein